MCEPLGDVHVVIGVGETGLGDHECRGEDAERDEAEREDDEHAAHARTPIRSVRWVLK